MIVVDYWEDGDTIESAATEVKPMGSNPSVTHVWGMCRSITCFLHEAVLAHTFTHPPILPLTEPATVMVYLSPQNPSEAIT